MQNLSSKAFLILGNSVSGTSLLHGLMNHHPQIDCLYEWFRNRTQPKVAIDEWRTAAKTAAKRGLIWGNKIPIEQFVTLKSKSWKPEQIIALIDDFKIVFIQRRYFQYAKSNAGHAQYREWWEFANFTIYWSMRDRHPDRIIAVSFEDLIQRPRLELNRVCEFLGISMKYNLQIKGTVNGKSRIDHHGFDLSRL